MIIYLLKSSAILFVLYLFYKLFLEEENMHVFKRYFLLVSLIASFGIPWLTYVQYVEPVQLDFQTTISTSTEIDNLPVDKDIPQYQYFLNILIPILWLIYGLGVILMSFRFSKNLMNIYIKIKRNTIVKTKQYSHVLIHNPVIPHTFLNYIFLHKLSYTENRIPKAVLIHEQTHALQKHSIDILLIELIQIVFWFNPLFYFIKKSIKLNHEFLADQAVLNNGVQIPVYQKILLMFSTNSQEPQLTHAINYSLIKKRFTVMKTQTTKRSIWLRSLVILPLLAVLIYGFSEKVIVEKEVKNNDSYKSNNELDKNNNSNQNYAIENIKIHIKVITKNQILLNNQQQVTLQTLGKEIKKLIKSYNTKQFEQIVAIIEAPDDMDMGFVIDIEQEIDKAGITYTRKFISNKNSISEKNYQDKIEKASKEQIGEYNKIAKKYNDMPQSHMTISKKEVGRLKYLYRIMTVKQRKNAEPFPVFPPPPPSPTFKKKERVYKATSPTPQIPKNPTFKQNEKNKSTVRGYVGEAPVIIYEYDPKTEQVIEIIENPKVITGLVEVVEVPSPPLSPDTPMELLLEMANKDARFYYNGDIISSKEAIKIMKEKSNINLAVISGKSKKPIVNLYNKSFKTKNLITK